MAVRERGKHQCILLTHPVMSPIYSVCRCLRLHFAQAALQHEFERGGIHLSADKRRALDAAQARRKSFSI